MRSRTARRRAGPVLLCAVLAVGLSPACSDDEPSSADPPTTTAPTTTTAPPTTLSPTEQDEQALHQLAEEWYESTDEIYANEAEPQSAEQFIVGDYLSGFINQVRDFREAGYSVRPSPTTEHVVESVTVVGDTGSVHECVVDADIVIGPDGRVLNDLVVTKRYATSAIRTEEGWRFTERSTRSEQEGRAQCDA